MDFRQQLGKALNDKYLHLTFDDITMSEYKGIGSISTRYPEIEDFIYETLKNIPGVNVYLETPANPAMNNIVFYSNEYKAEIECSEQAKDGIHRGPRALRHHYWREAAERVVVEYLKEKYDAPLGFENEYWYGLDTYSHNLVFREEVRTRGSEVEGNRRIEFELVERELEDHEIAGKILVDPLETQAEQDLYLWYNTDNDNFTSLLYTLIQKSSLENKAKLRSVYPYEVEVMDRFQKEDGYWDEIEKRYSN